MEGSSVWENKRRYHQSTHFHIRFYHPFHQWFHHYLSLRADTKLALPVYFFLIPQETYTGSSLSTWNSGLNKNFHSFYSCLPMYDLWPWLWRCRLVHPSPTRQHSVAEVWTSELQTWVWIPALPLTNYDLPHFTHEALAAVIFAPTSSSFRQRRKAAPSSLGCSSIHFWAEGW